MMMMNKYFATGALLATTMITVAINPTATPFFAKLLPTIERKASAWLTRKVSTLKIDQQLIFLNMFAPNADPSSHSSEILEASMHCTRAIQEDSETAAAFDCFRDDAEEIIQMYIEDFEKRLMTKNNLPENMQELWQKLEKKVYELFAYINAIYYKILYDHIQSQGVTEPTRMFNAQGIIPQQKRTKALPKP